MRRSSPRKNIRPTWRLLLAAGFALCVVSAGDVRAHFLWLTCERDTPAAAPVVQAFLSETPVPAGAEFLKHIEKARITADGKTLSWSKQEDTYSVSLPKTSAQDDRRILRPGRDETRRADLSLAVHGPRSVRAIDRRPTPKLGDLLRARLVERAGQAPVVVGQLPRPAGRGCRRQSVSRRQAIPWSSRPIKKAGSTTPASPRGEPVC